MNGMEPMVPGYTGNKALNSDDALIYDIIR